MKEIEKPPDRTPEDYVNDMLKRKRDWIAILAVARAIRKGQWYDKVKTILQDKNLMPKDQEMIDKLRTEAANLSRGKESYRFTTSKHKAGQIRDASSDQKG